MAILRALEQKYGLHPAVSGQEQDAATELRKVEYKAQCLISRVNNFFGNDWTAEPHCYPSLAGETGSDDMANIFITCTDNTKSRLALWKILKQAREMSLYDRQKPLYWMDFGNGQTFGQVLRGTISRKIKQPHSEKYDPTGWLPVITEYTNYARVKAEDSGPSCSLAEALEKQDLFINLTLAQLGCNLLWKMFRNGMIEHRGAYLNLDTLKVNPVLV